jgi:superfamily II DNA helicase RecQ
MLVRVMTLRFDPVLGGFDDTPLRDFCNALRDWRSERSKREGVPPYVICTNRQFAAMVKARPQSLATLAEIEGVGKAKLEKYGRDLLAILAPASDNHQPLPAPSAHEAAPDGHPAP